MSTPNGTEQNRTEQNSNAVIEIPFLEDTPDARAYTAELARRLRSVVGGAEAEAHMGLLVNVGRQVEAGLLSREAVQYATTQAIDDRKAVGRDGKPVIAGDWFGYWYGIIKAKMSEARS